MSEKVTAAQLLEILKALPPETPICFHADEFDKIYTDTGIYELTQKDNGRKLVLLGFRSANIDKINPYTLESDIDEATDEVVSKYTITRTLLEWQ